MRPGNLMKHLVMISLLCWTALAVSATPPDEQTLMISGYGAIVGNDQASARARAISDAYQRAVEQVLGTMVEARTFIQNDLMIRSEIYSRSDGYIKTHKILSEGPDRGRYRVTTQVTVSRQPINNDLVRLGLVQVAVDNPRVMILYDPGEARVPAHAEFAEQEFIRLFTERQFNLVDPDTAWRLHREAGELLRVESIENVAARLSLQHNAEVVVVYRLDAVHTGTDGIFEQGRATIIGRAIATTTAHLLGALTKTANGAAETPERAVADASTKAATEVANYLMSRMSNWWVSYVKNGIPYTVILESKPKRRLEAKFTDHLGGITGVVALNLRACGGDLCEYQVTYRGTTARLQRAILDAVATVRGLEQLSTKSIQGSDLVFTVK